MKRLHVAVQSKRYGRPVLLPAAAQFDEGLRRTAYRSPICWRHMVIRHQDAIEEQQRVVVPGR